MKERKWIDKIIKRHGYGYVAVVYNNFRSFVRYMDDNLFPTQRYDQDYGFFPEREDYGLDFKVTGGGSTVTFIGLQFKTERRGTQGDYFHEVTVTAFDKQKSFAFTLVRYPSWHSNLPRHIVTGSITGLLVRFFCLTSKTEDFIEQASDGLRRLHRLRDYPISVVKSGIVKFIKRNITPSYATTVKKALFDAVENVDNPVDVNAVRAPQPSGVVSTTSIQIPAPTADQAVPLIVQHPDQDQHEAPASASPAATKKQKSQSTKSQSARVSTPITASVTGPITRARARQLQALTTSVRVLSNEVAQVREALSSSPPASSTASVSQHPATPDLSQITMSVERRLRELYPQLASPDRDITSQTVLTESFNKTLASVCDTLRAQQQENIQLIRDVLARSEPPQQPNELVELLASTRSEANALTATLATITRDVASHPRDNNSMELLQQLLAWMAEAQREQANNFIQVALEEGRANRAVSDRFIELLASRPPPRPELPPAPQPLQITVEQSQPSVDLAMHINLIHERLSMIENTQRPTITYQQPQNEQLLAHFAELMLRSMEFQGRLIQSSEETVRTIRALVESNGETSRLLIENSSQNHQQLLTHFTTTMENVVRTHAEPIALLRPVLTRALDNLSTSRAIASSYRPLLIGPPPQAVTVTEVRDRSVGRDRESSISSSASGRTSREGSVSGNKRARSPDAPPPKVNHTESTPSATSGAASDVLSTVRPSSPEPQNPSTSC
jgi:hypothetical protein